MEVLVNAMVVIILQYKNVLNQHLKLQNVICQLYLNKAGGEKNWAHTCLLQDMSPFHRETE